MSDQKNPLEDEIWDELSMELPLLKTDITFGVNYKPRMKRIKKLVKQWRKNEFSEDKLGYLLKHYEAVLGSMFN